MRLVTTPESRLELSRALRLMSEALDILDELGAPGDIGGILDLAVARLAKLLDRKDPFATGAQEFIAQLERELGMVRPRGTRELSPWEAPPCP